MTSTPDRNNQRGDEPTLPGEPFDEQRALYLVQTVAMSLLILVLLYIILWKLAAILQPLFVAIFICYLIVPAHRWLVARRIPSSVSYIIIIGGFLMVMFSAGGMAYQGVKKLSKEMPAHIERIRDAVDDTGVRVRDSFGRLLHHDEPEEEEKEDGELEMSEGDPLALAITTQVAEATPVDPDAVVDVDMEDDDGDPEDDGGDEDSDGEESPLTATQPASAAVTEWISSQTLVGWGQTLIDPLFGLITSTLVVVFYLIFLLAEVAGFHRRLVNAFGAVRAHRILQVLGSINAAISHYIVVKTLVSLMVAALSTAILLAFDVRYAVMWGLLTFFANFIPYVGSMVAVILPVLMQFALAGPSIALLIMLVLLISAQMAIGSLLEPRMIGRKLGISPLIILLGLAFWGMLWGIPGMVLSAPLMVAAKIVLENIEQTRSVARLLSDV